MGQVLEKILKIKFIFVKRNKGNKTLVKDVKRCNPEHKNEIEKIWDEAQELTLIFGKILSTLNKNF